MQDRFKIAQEFAKKIKSDDIKLIILFGSVARGEDKTEPDIDILIVSPNLNKIESHIDDEVVNIILNKNEFISAHLMTENHFNKTKNYPFLTNVLNEGVILAQ